MWNEISVYNLPLLGEVVLLCDKDVIVLNGFGYRKVIAKRIEGFAWQVIEGFKEYPLTYFSHWKKLEKDP